MILEGYSNKYSKKLKILQLGSPSGLYGAERWILALIKHLDPEKIESWVLSIKDEPNLDIPLCREAERLGYPTHVFECYGKVNFSAVRQLRKFVQQNDIDILHTHGYKTDLIGFFATRYTPCKIVSTPHGWTQKPDIKLRFYEIFNRSIFPFFDAVAPVSEDLYRALSLIPGMKTKLYLIRNGVDLNEIEGAGNVASEISTLKKGGVLVIGYIGRLIHGKGLETLLYSVSRYAEPHWRIAILGEGEQLVELECMVERLNIKKQVKFFGFKSNRLSFLKGFDIFVLPSRSEGIPRCLMEAMASGVSVVASDIPGCRHLVDGKTTGLLFQLDQPKKLADSIKRLGSDPILRDRMRLKGREFVRSKFSATRMAEEYEKLYMEMQWRQSKS